jgi:hypothetical protein
MIIVGVARIAPIVWACSLSILGPLHLGSLMLIFRRKLTPFLRGVRILARLAISVSVVVIDLR